MDDRGANIDLLFRNGLKDYEVLPPAEAWDTIQPVVIKQAPFFFRRFLRAAAMITTISTLSIVAWMLSREQVMETFAPMSAFNILQPDPLNAQPAPAGQPVIRIRESVFSLMDDQEVTDFTFFEYPSELNTISEPISGKVNFQLQGQSAIAPLFSRAINPMIIEPGTSESFQNFEVVVPGLTLPANSQPAERWSISALASPTYYSKFGSTEIDPVDVASEEYAASYSGGLSVAYKISRRLSIQTGVYYASHGQNIEGINSFSGFQQYVQAKGGHNFELATTNGTVITSNADVFLLAEGTGGRLSTQYTSDIFDPVKASLRYIDNSLIQNFSYLQMPVMLRYKLIDRQLDFNIVGGLASDFLIGNSAYANENGNRYRIGQTDGVNTLAFSSSLGMGMEYSFSKKLSLNLEPTFRYFINPFQSQTGPRVYPYSFGVFSGFSYKF